MLMSEQGSVGTCKKCLKEKTALKKGLCAQCRLAIAKKKALEIVNQDIEC